MKNSGIGKRRLAAKNEGRDHYLERRSALVSAAAKLFSEKGFSATSLDDVAQLSGIDRSSVYYYISSKKDLFYEVVGESIERTTEKATEIASGPGDPMSKLTDLMVTLMQSYEENYPHLYVFLQEDVGKIKSANINKLVKTAERFDTAVRQMVQEGMDLGILRSDIPKTIVAHALVGMANWSHRWFKPGGDNSAAEIGAFFAKMALQGLVQRPSETENQGR